MDFEKEDCSDRLQIILKTNSFFSEPKLTIIGHSFGRLNAKVIHTQGWTLRDNLIFYENLSIKDLEKKDKELFKFLNKEAKEIKEFENLKGSGLEKWALEKITEAGFSIKSLVLKKLIIRVVSQEQLSQEIDKLIAYQSYHHRKEIDDKTVIKLTQGPTLRVDNFALIDAIGARDIKKAITFLNKTLTDGTEPHAVLGQIIYQFRNLLKAKSYTAALYLQGSRVTAENIAKLTGLHPFVARKTSQQARQFDLDELKKIYRLLSELDIKSKTGQIDLSAGLFKFILTIQF